MSAGRFITLEGGEGSGKSTQARRIAAQLCAHGLPVLLTREPGGTAGAEAIRQVVLAGHGLDPVAEALLMTSARREHVVAAIRPARAAGMWVVCDRFADSTLAYQGYGQGVAETTLQTLAGLALEGLRPDLTFVLDLPVQAGLARVAARGIAADRFERLDAAFHARIRDGFRAIAAAEPERCVLIDAGPAPDAVFAQIARHLPA